MSLIKITSNMNIIIYGYLSKTMSMIWYRSRIIVQSPLWITKMNYNEKKYIVTQQSEKRHGKNCIKLGNDIVNTTISTWG